MRHLRSLLLLFFIAGVGGQPAQNDKSSLKVFYDQHQWFQLREAADSTPETALYRGAVGCAFNHLKTCEKLLQAAIHAAPFSQQSYEAHSILEDAYLRTGLYRRARAEAKLRLAIKPDDDDAKGDLALLKNLCCDQSVSSRRITRIHGRLEDGLPISVNGHDARFFFDTGAELSILSELEARRLGLAVHGSEGKTQNITGGTAGFKTAVADDLSVGNFRLKHVTFLVFSDDQPPFNSISPGRRGLIGLPVLLALKTVHWGADGILEFGFPSASADTEQPTIGFDGPTPIIQAEFRGQKLTFLLDTGAQETFLYPPFARAFPTLLRELGTRESKRVTGVGQSTNLETIKLPGVRLQISGFDASFAPARVFLTETVRGSRYYAGNIGMDVLSQANSVTLDFQAMRITLR